MDEVSSHVALDLPFSLTARPSKRLFRLVLNPMVEGPGADSEEKREPVSDIDTAAVDSLKVLDPNRPIREADIAARADVRLVPIASLRTAENNMLFDHPSARASLL